VLSEADLKVARIADERIAEAFAQLDVGTVEEFRALREDLRWIHEWRAMLAGIRQKLCWLVISCLVVAMLSVVRGSRASRGRWAGTAFS
jgi:hypothetical protein